MPSYSAENSNGSSSVENVAPGFLPVRPIQLGRHLLFATRYIDPPELDRLIWFTKCEYPR